MSNNSVPGKTLSNKSEVKTFPDKQKLKKFVTIRETYNKVCKEFFKMKRKDSIDNRLKLHDDVKISSKGDISKCFYL